MFVPLKQLGQTILDPLQSQQSYSEIPFFEIDFSAVLGSPKLKKKGVEMLCKDIKPIQATVAPHLQWEQVGWSDVFGPGLSRGQRVWYCLCCLLRNVCPLKPLGQTILDPLQSQQSYSEIPLFKIDFSAVLGSPKLKKKGVEMLCKDIKPIQATVAPHLQWEQVGWSDVFGPGRSRGQRVWYCLCCLLRNVCPLK